jgi:hypothetical protein
MDEALRLVLLPPVPAELADRAVKSEVDRPTFSEDDMLGEGTR